MPNDDELFDTDGLPQGVDDEMKDLLGELDEPDGYVTDHMVSETPGVSGDVSPPIHVAPTPPAEPTPPPEAPKTSEVRRLDSTPQVVTSEPSPVLEQPEPVVDIKKQFEQFDAIAEEVIQGTRHDRQETQDAINLYRAEISKSINAGQNPPRMYIDNLAKLLEVKVNSNLTTIKALEAKAKLLAATKAGVQVQTNTTVQNANTTVQADSSLIDLLNSNPLQSSGDDEF